MSFAQLLIQGLIAGLLLGGLYSLVGLGITLIVGVMGVVNFSHGAILMLSMYAAYWISVYTRISPYVLLIVVVPLFFLVGVGLQRTIIKPLLVRSFDVQILVTFGLSLFLVNFALLIWKADFRSVVTPFSYSSIIVGEVTIGNARLIAFLVSIVAAMIFYAFLQKTKTGKAMRAVAQDRILASLLGVHVVKIDALAFGVGAACAAIAGVLILPFYYVFPTVGDTFLLSAFATIVLGGFGNFMGALIGGLIIGVVEGLTSVALSSELKQAASFLIVILVLLYRPEGLFTRRLRE
jgi:branched-chain amino acid transport system permease protein